MARATAAALFLLASSALAGVPRAQGPASLMSGSPLGYTAVLHPDIRVKTAGFATGLPPAWPAGTPRPDFAGFVRERTPPGLSRPLPLLAMSLGIDVLATTETALRAGDFPDEPAPLGDDYEWYPVLDLGDHGWYAIVFSVDGAMVGPMPDLAPDIEAAGDERDRSVFCYVLPTSTTTALPEEAESVRVLRPDALDLADRRDGIVALNMHMALYWTDLARYPDVFTTRPLPERPVLYFTLDTALLSKDDLALLASEWGGALPTSTTIWGSVWNGARWESPQVYARAGDLRLDVPNGVAIDGLALDTKGTNDRADDDLLFSLRGTSGHAVDASAQVQYVSVVDTTPTTSPRPVVVRRRGHGYGSLGRQMRGGMGIGDFCTADPWVVAAQRGIRTTVFDADALLDDFFIARRLPPADPYVVVGTTPAGLRLEGFVPATLATSLPFGAMVDAGGTFPDAESRVLLPYAGLRLRAPEMGLAIAGYRYYHGERAYMRACMSGPFGSAGTGEATVRWGVIQDYVEPTSAAGNVAWTGSRDLPYAGAPFTWDVELPTEGGVLEPRTRSRPSASLPGAGTKDTHRRIAFVMQWKLRLSDRTLVSPIAALRY